MTATDKSIISIFECVECSITCEFCGEKSNGEDPFEIAEYAQAEGWRVRKDKLRCPNCLNKTKK